VASAALVGGLCPARFDQDIGGGGGRGSEESSKWGGQQKAWIWRQKSRGAGQSQVLQWEFHMEAAKGVYRGG